MRSLLQLQKKSRSIFINNKMFGHYCVWWLYAYQQHQSQNTWIKHQCPSPCPNTSKQMQTLSTDLPIRPSNKEDAVWKNWYAYNIVMSTPSSVHTHRINSHKCTNAQRSKCQHTQCCVFARTHNIDVQMLIFTAVPHPWNPLWKPA